MPGKRSPEDVGNSGVGTHGHTPAVDVVERAADIVDWHRGNVITAKEGLQIAQQLADAGLLCSDADRAVLDAADKLFDRNGHMRAAHYGSLVLAPIRAAVLARRAVSL